MIFGLASSGLHSNGFSLVRRIVAEAGLDYAAAAPFAEASLGAALLTPTRIYVGACLAAHRAGVVRGFAHITGGGFAENVARILPDETAAEIETGCPCQTRQKSRLMFAWCWGAVSPASRI